MNPDTPTPDPAPIVPPPAANVAPITTAPIGVAPITVAPPPRRFAWGTFFIGFGAGVLMIVMLLVAGGIVLAVVAARIVNEQSSGTSMLTPPTFPDNQKLSIYGEAEPTWTVHTLDGTPTTLGAYRGKVVFVNFWATWCGPCVSEMPSIQRLQEKMKDAPVQFLLVSDESPATIEKFLKMQKWTLQPFHGDGKPPSLFRTDGIPATFIVNPRGAVVFRHIGMAQWDADVVVRFLKGLS